MLAVWTALLAGAITVYALREELPGKSQLRFWSFSFGIASFSTVILVVRHMEKS